MMEELAKGWEETSTEAVRRFQGDAEEDDQSQSLLDDMEDPVLKICFGPPTAESKNLKNHVNFDVGDLFFRSPALWSSQNVFGPPTAGRVVVDFKDRVLGIVGQVVEQDCTCRTCRIDPHLRQTLKLSFILSLI